MTLTFLIERSNQYRLFAPIIDAALGAGWSVECWHDQSQHRESTKADQVPDKAAVPQFLHGVPLVKNYRERSELRAALRAPRVDAVVSLQTAPFYFGGAYDGPPWLWLQYASDFAYHNSPDDLLSADVAGVYSSWWTRWAADNFRAEGQLRDGSMFERTFNQKAVVVGFPELDAASLIDPAEVRRRWNIPADKPVVTLLPFPAGVGKAAFWPRKVFGEPNSLKQTVSVLRHGRFEYWPDIAHGWNDRNVVRAIRQFCDRNDAMLVVKARTKTPIPSYLAAVADRQFYDESWYPATILEALSISSLCISFYSAAVTEAVALGVPHLCIAFDVDNYFDVDLVARGRSKRLYTRDEGGLYQFEGVATTMSIREAVELLADKSLAAFRMNPGARKEYVEKFLGYDDRSGSARTVRAIAQACRRRGDQVAAHAAGD